MLKVLPQLSPLDPFLPYLIAFQWGTVWPYTSSGIKNIKNGKLWDMANMSQESLVLAALLASVKASWKVILYYINRALLKSIITHCIYKGLKDENNLGSLPIQNRA